ncbi:MAG: serine--tRNA ligase [Pseudomonadales bacterium]
MLDIKRIRSHALELQTALAKKGFQLDLEQFNELDARRKTLDVRAQELQAERNQASKQIGKLVQSGVPVEEAKASVNETIAKLADELAQAQAQAKEVQTELDELLLSIPNAPDDDVPEGTDEEDNIEISRWGEPRVLDFEAKDHVDLGAELKQLDFEVAGKITGSRFAVMQGRLARLHRALIQFMLDTHTQQHGYTELNVPYIVNRESLFGTGQLPKFEEDLFKLDDERGYYLIPTAEVPVTNMFRDTIVESLPVAFAAHTPCFRSEAGSYGRDTKGMIRQHQFEKVELVQFVEPGQSNTALDALTGHAETILQKLNLPYRKVMLCGGDLGFSAQRTYDLEVWLPGQDKYREISSCSNFGDYQARRMKARWRNPATNKPEYLHTLNGSGLAVGRTLVAVMENYQREDGGIDIPQVLQGYMGGATEL